MIKAFGETPQFKIEHNLDLTNVVPSAESGEIITNFERKAREKGHPIHSIILKRCKKKG
jgi:hypothetical protein